jgi:uncharacterized protein (TIGR02246 family)
LEHRRRDGVRCRIRRRRRLRRHPWGTPSGTSRVAAGHQALSDSLYAGSAIRYQLHTARQLTPECVVAVADATLDTPAGPAAEVHRSRLTAVVTAEGDTWTIAAFHNSLVQAHA